MPADAKELKFQFCVDEPSARKVIAVIEQMTDRVAKLVETLSKAGQGLSNALGGGGATGGGGGGGGGSFVGVSGRGGGGGSGGQSRTVPFSFLNPGSGIANGLSKTLSELKSLGNIGETAMRAMEGAVKRSVDSQTQHLQKLDNLVNRLAGSYSRLSEKEQSGAVSPERAAKLRSKLDSYFTAAVGSRNKAQEFLNDLGGGGGGEPAPSGGFWSRNFGNKMGLGQGLMGTAQHAAGAVGAGQLGNMAATGIGGLAGSINPYLAAGAIAVGGMSLLNSRAFTASKAYNSEGLAQAWDQPNVLARQGQSTGSFGDAIGRGDVVKAYYLRQILANDQKKANLAYITSGSRTSNNDVGDNSHGFMRGLAEAQSVWMPWTKMGQASSDGRLGLAEQETMGSPLSQVGRAIMNDRIQDKFNFARAQREMSATQQEQMVQRVNAETAADPEYANYLGGEYAGSIDRRISLGRGFRMPGWGRQKGVYQRDGEPIAGGGTVFPEARISAAMTHAADFVQAGFAPEQGAAMQRMVEGIGGLRAGAGAAKGALQHEAGGLRNAGQMYGLSAIVAGMRGGPQFGLASALSGYGGGAYGGRGMDPTAVSAMGDTLMGGVFDGGPMTNGRGYLGALGNNVAEGGGGGARSIYLQQAIAAGQGALGANIRGQTDPLQHAINLVGANSAFGGASVYGRRMVAEKMSPRLLADILGGSAIPGAVKAMLGDSATLENFQKYQGIRDQYSMSRYVGGTGTGDMETTVAAAKKSGLGLAAYLKSTSGSKKGLIANLQKYGSFYEATGEAGDYKSSFGRLATEAGMGDIAKKYGGISDPFDPNSPEGQMKKAEADRMRKGEGRLGEDEKVLKQIAGALLDTRTALGKFSKDVTADGIAFNIALKDMTDALVKAGKSIAASRGVAYGKAKAPGG